MASVVENMPQFLLKRASIKRNMCKELIFMLAVGLSLLSGLESYSSHQCEEKEKSSAALDLAKDSICKAKDLYPACKGDNATLSECSKKDKALGYIDVALNLISEAKDNMPVCNVSKPPHELKLHVRPMDCLEVLENGHNRSGVYSIWPRSRVVSGALDVLCDMTTEGGGWTVIQRRGNFSIQENFDRDWKDYKKGFGSLSRDFWIGNDNIHALSNQGVYAARFDMKDVNEKSAYARFQNFFVEDEYSNYTLHLGHYNGTSGDSMTYHSGSMFSTKDVKNDNYTSSCAQMRKSGFWFHKCSYCNPNGLYHPGAKNQSQNMYWSSWKGLDGLKAMEIKLKRL